MSDLPDDERDDGEHEKQLQELLRQATLPEKKLQELFRQAALPEKQLQELFRQAALPEKQLQELFRQATLPEKQLQELFRQAAVSEEQLQELFRQATLPEKQLQELIRQASVPEEQLQEALRRATFEHSQLQELFRAAFLPNQQVQAILRQLTRPSERLVPERALEAEADEPLEPVKSGDEVPASIAQLRQILEAAGREAEVTAREFRDETSVELTFTLPAGRDEREVVVDGEAAEALVADPDFLAWRSLTAYDGIWNERTGVIEAAIQVPRFGPSPRQLQRRLHGTDNPGESIVEVEDPSSGGRLVVRRADNSAWAILGYRYGLRRRPLTVRCEGYSVSTTEEAENLIVRLTDSLFFDIEVNFGMSMALGRLGSPQRSLRWYPTNRTNPSFPANEYPHAPMLLYRLGRDRLLPPVVRYWALYQVLEYFFPKYSNEKTLRRLSRHLRSPNFDPHREEDLLKAIDLVGTTTNAGERELLTTTLEAITSPDEVRRVISTLGIADALRRDGRELSSEMVTPEAEDVVRQLGRRMYDLRCSIVHSKGAGAELGPGLLAGTDHDDLIQPELPLLEYLAQQALIGSAEPLR